MTSKANVCACVLTVAVPAALNPAVVRAGTEVLYVDDDGGCGDGLSWETAAFDLGTALDLAAGNAGVTEIRIAGGTYVPTGPQDNPFNPSTRTYQLVSDVILRGGYAGIGAPDPAHHPRGELERLGAARKRGRR